MSVRWLSLLWLAVGLGLLGWLLRDLDYQGMAATLGRVGWRGLSVLPLALAWIIPNTVAWGYSFKRPGVPFSTLFPVRIAGESLNDLLPSSNLGGEPMKALLLRPSVDFSEALSSVTVAKTTQTIAMALFIAGGLGLAARRGPLPPEVLATAAGVLAMLGGGAAVLVFGAASGRLGALLRRAPRFVAESERFKSLMGHVVSFEACLTSFYATEKGRFGASTFWHLVGLVAGSVELYWIAILLGFPLTATEAFIMEVVTTLFGVGGFLIPGSIGAFEFGHVVAGSMLGLPAAGGVLVSLLRRFRELFWLLAGLAILSIAFPGAWKDRPALRPAA